MTTPNPPAIAPNSTKPSWFPGCILTIFAVLFGILGTYDLVYGSIIAYIFFSVRILSPASIAVILIIACDCIIYFILAFRVKRQRWFVSLAFLAVIWLVLPLPFTFLINTATMRVRNDGFSMEPALSSGSYIIADRQAYQSHLPQRGDVIIFQLPGPANSDIQLIKRIIGVPGEVVKIDQGQVSINGVHLNEPYITEQAIYSGEWKVPNGQYFVLGDNRNDSKDSHQWGFLPQKYILAKAVWIYWPSTHFGKIADINFVP
jgi:signal peptidase I